MLKKTTCLVVDDDADDIGIFKFALKSLDGEMECFADVNGEDAMHRLKMNDNFVPDLIFLDLNIPRMNGKKCLKEMRQITRLDHIPIIIYSTSSDDKDIRETLELGANYFLTKPSSITSLVRTLIELLQQSDWQMVNR